MSPTKHCFLSRSPAPKVYPWREQHCGKAVVIFGVFTVRRAGWKMDPSASRKRRNIDPLVEAEEHKKEEDGGLTGGRCGISVHLCSTIYLIFLLHRKSCTCM